MATRRKKCSLCTSDERFFSALGLGCKLKTTCERTSKDKEQITRLWDITTDQRFKRLSQKVLVEFLKL